MPRNEHPPEYYKSFKRSTFHYKNNSRITPQEIKGKNFQKTSKYFFWGKWLQLGLSRFSSVDKVNEYNGKKFLC